jgi:HPr kinase/phosphorylase
MRVVTGEAGFSRAIFWGRIQRPGLALAGFIPYIKPGRIQILGESELNYLDTMPAEVRRERIEAICALPVAAFVITKGQKSPEDIVRECRRRQIPLLVSDRTTSVVIQSITRVLEDELAPATTLHGVLVDVYGMGVLLLGESGIGKSECALDLVHRGHRLVADDAVEIRRYPSGALVGRAAEMIRYHMELRGIGIINIKHLFGVSAVRTSKSIELVIELQRWDPAKKYDRLGLDGETYTILERERPLLRLPVASGRNLALLIEIAARNELLKSQGYDAAKEFARRVDEEIAKNSPEGARWK